MDHERFDDLTKAIAARLPRRAALRAITALAATPLALLGAADMAGKGKKKGRKRKDRGKKNKPPPPPPKECPGGCAGCQTCADGACVDIVPLCEQQECMQPVCDEASKQWKCTEKPGVLCDESQCEVRYCNSETGEWDCAIIVCEVGRVCCNGHCELACTNGCDPDPDVACLCEKAPPGRVFCKGACHDECGPRRKWVPEFCTCVCAVKNSPRGGCCEDHPGERVCGTSCCIGDCCVAPDGRSECCCDGDKARDCFCPFLGGTWQRYCIDTGRSCSEFSNRQGTCVDAA